eukprot:Skav204629  [mRNA]  locus=scaffold1712:300378:302282:- [translate_table: standard]
MEATMDLLERAGQKLDFRPEDLLAWTADQAIEKPPATRKGEHPQSQFCHCGLETVPPLDCLQTLCNHLEQMVKDQLRKGRPILLHVQRKVVGMPRTEPLEEDHLNMGKPRRSESAAYKAHGGAAAASSCSQLPCSSGPAGRAQKLQKQSPGDLRWQAQSLWATLEKAKVYIPPLDAEQPEHCDKFQLERHGHGRGNTKSTKKRRKRQDRHDLCRLILHLEQLALDHGLAPAVAERETRAHGDDSSSSDDLCDGL